VTDDHVPPRSFYGNTPPDNLITVPACEQCNRGFGQIDDYVRFVLITSKNKDNLTRKELIPTVRRYAERSQSRRQLAHFYQSLETGYLRNSEGIFVQRQKFEVEGAKMDAFAVRLVKALFCREKGYHLPAEYIVNPIHYRQLPYIAEASGTDRDFWPLIITRLMQSPQRRQWGDVFGYSWVQSPNDANATWWLLGFYGRTQYLCSTWNAAGAHDWPHEAKRR
jgi:hypothetical protein